MEKCGDLCPYEEADLWSQEVGQLFMRCAEKLPTKEDEAERYSIDIARFEFSLKLYQIPPDQWLEADKWMRSCVDALNAPRSQSFSIDAEDEV